MTTLTDRERELVEAARLVIKTGYASPWRESLFKALRAYDPPKARKYTMPEWDQFLKQFAFQQKDYQRPGFDGCAFATFVYKDGYAAEVQREHYNAIREALAVGEDGVARPTPAEMIPTPESNSHA